MTSDEYRAVFQASPDGILVVDGEGTILDVNPMAVRLFRWSKDELVGRKVEILVPDSARGVHHAHRDRYMRHPRARPMGIGMELRGLRKDGSEFPVEISLSPWESSEGQKVIVTVRDETQRRRLRDFSAGALRASEDERKRIARELHDDTAQHLAALLLRLRLMERDVPDDEWRARMEELRTSLASCADGVRRIARGLRPPELEDAGVVAALRAHARTVRDASDLEVHFDAEAVDELLGLDAKLVLYRIIQEASSNALRHAGSPTLKIRVFREDERVVGVVEDEGRGFLPGGDPTEGGSGLGLVGMQERAGMVGGRVSVDSEPGRGTTVRVELPRSRTNGRS